MVGEGAASMRPYRGYGRTNDRGAGKMPTLPHYGKTAIAENGAPWRGYGKIEEAHRETSANGADNGGPYTGNVRPKRQRRR
jgi:hypothetical protein